MYAAATISVCVLFISFGDMGGCQKPNNVVKFGYTDSDENPEINAHNL